MMIISVEINSFQEYGFVDDEGFINSIGKHYRLVVID